MSLDRCGWWLRTLEACTHWPLCRPPVVLSVCMPWPIQLWSTLWCGKRVWAWLSITWQLGYVSWCSVRPNDLGYYKLLPSSSNAKLVRQFCSALLGEESTWYILSIIVLVSVMGSADASSIKSFSYSVFTVSCCTVPSSPASLPYSHSFPPYNTWMYSSPQA